MGLLLPHKRTVVRVYPDMVCVSTSHDNHTGGGKRNEIRSFSPESRYRLFRLLHSIRFDRVSFVTLTYGNTFPRDSRVAKIHLKAFRRATERRYGRIPALWRMEYQLRGAPHFHIMYFDPPYIPVADWNDLWDNASRRPENERYGNSLDIKFNASRLDSAVIGRYIGKYIGKTDERVLDEIPGKPGRIWGKWNIPQPKAVEIEISAVEKARLDKLLLPADSASGWHPASTDAYTVFGGTMGRENLANQVLWELGLLMSYTRRVEVRKVTLDSCI